MNKLYIIGNVTRDAEVRTTQNGVNVCSFSVAVNDRKAKNSDQQTQFFNVSAWRGLADVCGQYVKRGMKVCVVGSVGIRTYTTQKGENRADLVVTADDVEFLSRTDGDHGQEQSSHTSEPEPDNDFTNVSEEIGDELPF